MEFINKLQAITKNLEKSEKVTKYSTPVENQADTLANAFIDIEESMVTIIREQIPKLYLHNLNSSEVDELLSAIGEEFRHILYHINDTKLYNHLMEGQV